MEMLFLSLVLGRSQVITMRRSHDDGCRRKQFINVSSQDIELFTQTYTPM
jgi:hypothetical protein